MPTVTASIGISVETWEKCRHYKINRSAIARRAIEEEIAKIENAGAVIRQDSAPTADLKEGISNVGRSG